MGDPRKIRKKYKRPRKPWDKDVLVESIKLAGEYGLRNKREVWRAMTLAAKYKKIARKILSSGVKRDHQLETAVLKKLIKLGILEENAKIGNLLDITAEDFLKRRLQTLVFKKGLARSIYEARQLVVHGHIKIGDRVIKIPSYIVSREEEPLINSTLKVSQDEQKEG